MEEDRVLERLESESREFPFCGCGAPTAPVVRAGRLWLDCVSLSEPRSRIGRLLATAGHTHRLIVADPELFGRTSAA